MSLGPPPRRTANASAGAALRGTGGLEQKRGSLGNNPGSPSRAAAPAEPDPQSVGARRISAGPRPAGPSGGTSLANPGSAARGRGAGRVAAPRTKPRRTVADLEDRPEWTLDFTGVPAPATAADASPAGGRGSD